MIRVERAVVEDAEQILEVKKRAFAPEFELYGVIPPGAYSLEKQRVSIAERTFYKVLYNGQLAGGICLVEQANGDLYVSGVFIDEPFQNLGIGKEAMKLVENEYGTGRTWRLETPYMSFRNHHFYESMGYSKVGEYTPEYSEDKNFILFLYEKRR